MRGGQHQHVVLDALRVQVVQRHVTGLRKQHRIRGVGDVLIEQDLKEIKPAIKLMGIALALHFVQC